MIHYDRAQPGQWTYHPDPWCQMAIFRKDGQHDSVKTGKLGFDFDLTSDDWAFYCGDRAQINRTVLDRMLDLMNKSEAAVADAEAFETEQDRLISEMRDI